MSVLLKTHNIKRLYLVTVVLRSVEMNVDLFVIGSVFIQSCLGVFLSQG